MSVSSNTDTMRSAEGTRSVAGYAFDEYRIDIASRSLRCGDDLVPIPSRAFDSLLYLVANRDRLIHKNELVGAAWNDVIVTDASLVHAISVLRRALSDDSNQPRYIQTVPRRGYKFIGTVSVVTDRQPASGNVDVLTQDAPATNEPLVAAPVAGTAKRRPLARRYGVALALIAPLVAWLSLQPVGQLAGSAKSLQLFQPPPLGSQITSGGVISPGGNYLTFAARDNRDGKTSLWLRVLSSSKLRHLEGTDGASKPFWSPDGKQIGFFANGEMMAVSVSSGAPRTIASNVGGSAAGGSWGPHDTILFADWAHGLFVVSADGGPVTHIAKVDREQRDIAFAWPQFLPDGRHFLYHVTSLNPDRTGAYVSDIETLRSVRVLATDSPAVFVEPSRLLHVEDGVLIAEEMDLRDFTLTGRGTLLAREVRAPSLSDENSISAAGPLLAFVREQQGRNLVWVDRSGATLSTLSLPMTLSNPRLSPDRSTLLATGSLTSDADLWLASPQRSEFKRLEADATAPLWAPDGQRIAFVSGTGIYVRALDTSAGNPLVTNSDVKVLNDWSPDGTHIVYSELSEHSRLDLWQVRLRDGAATPLLATPANETQARLSPSGRWLAYVSDEGGAANVYVTDYPALVEKHLVSSAGGGQPQWGGDERELFYMAPDRSIVSVEIDATRERMVIGPPTRLFRAPLTAGPNDARDSYIVAADSTKFLIDSTDIAGPAITIMVNWAGTEESLRERSWRELIAGLWHRPTG